MHQRTSKQILGNNQKSSIFALANHASLLLSIFHHLEVMVNDGHVERMDNERLLKKAMNAKVDGRSARGRPRFRWMDGVKRALIDRRMDVREARERARNRNEWRMIVKQF